MQKTIAIHQPNYFPWLGYFYKIYASDVFVFHENVEHSKRYPTRRTHIRKTANGSSSTWLTVPLKKHSDFTIIKNLVIDHSLNWQKKHCNKILNAYNKAPHFEKYFPQIEKMLFASYRFRLLSDFNIFLILGLSQIIGIQKTTYRTSELLVEGNGSLYNIEIIKYLGGSKYLSGSGGSNYQSEKEFSQSDISLIYSSFAESFEQTYPNSPIGLSVLDSLFYQGAENLKSFLEKCGQN